MSCRPALWSGVPYLLSSVLGLSSLQLAQSSEAQIIFHACCFHSPFPKTLKWFPISFWVIFKLLPIGFKTFSQAIPFYVTFNLSPSCSRGGCQNRLHQATRVMPSLLWAVLAFTYQITWYQITRSWLCPPDSSLPLTECLKSQQTSVAYGYTSLQKQSLLTWQIQSPQAGVEGQFSHKRY